MSASTLGHATATGDPQAAHGDLIRRALIALGLLGIALIHVLDLPGQFPDAYLVGVGYLLVIVASVVTVEVIIRRPQRRFLLAAAVIAAAPLIGYVLSRTVGIPQDDSDIGNWLQPLGLASLFVEGAVILLSVLAWMPPWASSDES